MSVRRHLTRLLLGPEDVPASRDDFEVVGAFNPGAVRVGGEVVLLVRVAERPRERRPGWIGHPRWTPEDGVRVGTWLPDDEHEAVDARVIRRKSDGTYRLTFISHLRVVRLGDDGKSCSGRCRRSRSGRTRRPRNTGPRTPDHDDRGSTLFHLRRGLSARARDGPGVHDRLPFVRSSRDHLLPREQGRRPLPRDDRRIVRGASSAGLRQSIHSTGDLGRPIARPDSFGEGTSRSTSWEANGNRDALVAASPIRIDGGWLESSRWEPPPGPSWRCRGAYCGGAVLLDCDDPSLVLKRTAGPFFTPEADFEVSGFVPNVVFPTGVVEAGENLLVYYGAADSRVAVAEFSTKDVLGDDGRRCGRPDGPSSGWPSKLGR